MDSNIGWGKIAALGFLVFVGLLLVGWGTSWFGLVTQRPMRVFQEETRAQVYDTSRQYQQGTNRDIARYCEQMRTAEGPAQKAVAALIRSTVSTYDGPLSPDNKDCVSEAEGY